MIQLGHCGLCTLRDAVFHGEFEHAALVLLEHSFRATCRLSWIGYFMQTRHEDNFGGSVGFIHSKGSVVRHPICCRCNPDCRVQWWRALCGRHPMQVSAVMRDLQVALAISLTGLGVFVSRILSRAVDLYLQCVF